MTDEQTESVVPSATIAEEGLLHDWNSRVFWPYGLTLVMRRWDDPQTESFDAWWRKVAYDTRQDLTNFRHRMGKADPMPDEVVTEVLEATLRNLRNTLRRDAFLPGLELRAIEPPEVIVSALIKEEQADRVERAQRWLRERRGRIRDAVLGGAR